MWPRCVLGFAITINLKLRHHQGNHISGDIVTRTETISISKKKNRLKNDLQKLVCYQMQLNESMCEQDIHQLAVVVKLVFTDHRTKGLTENTPSKRTNEE